jgi:hypothetical protein
MIGKLMLALGSIELVGAEDILSHEIVKNILKSLKIGKEEVI